MRHLKKGFIATAIVAACVAGAVYATSQYYKPKFAEASALSAAQQLEVNKLAVELKSMNAAYAAMPYEMRAAFDLNRKAITIIESFGITPDKKLADCISYTAFGVGGSMGPTFTSNSCKTGYNNKEVYDLLQEVANTKSTQAGNCNLLYRFGPSEGNKECHLDALRLNVATEDSLLLATTGYTFMDHVDRHMEKNK